MEKTNPTNGVAAMLPARIRAAFCVLAAVSILALAPAAEAADSAVRFVPGPLKAYDEFDSRKGENPDGYYWCGHAALKSVCGYVDGDVRSLQSIHKLFWNGSAGYRTRKPTFSAALQDLMWAASKAAKAGGFGLSAELVSCPKTADGVIAMVKPYVDAGSPVIIPSDYYYGAAGHFWIVVGYAIRPTGKTLYLKNVCRPANPASVYDNVVEAGTFARAVRPTRVEGLVIRQPKAPRGNG